MIVFMAQSLCVVIGEELFFETKRDPLVIFYAFSNCQRFCTLGNAHNT